MGYSNNILNTSENAFPLHSIKDDNGNTISPNNSTTNSNPASFSFDNNNQNSNDTSLDTTFNPRSGNFFFPLATTVHTWNTKRLLPSVLLSQYTAFSCLFLIDDLNGAVFSAKQTGLEDSILFGAPTDTVAHLSREAYTQIDNNIFSQSGLINNPPNSKISILDNLHTTLFFSDALKNNVFKLSNVKGIPASILGYNKGAEVNLIPLSIKMSQITTPDAKGLLELGDIEVEYLKINGYIQAKLSIYTYDINQIFAMQTVASRLFQNFNKYLLIFGWQGPTVDNIKNFDFSEEDKSKYGIVNSQVNSLNSMIVTLLDGSSYDMYLPTPFVNSDGLLNFQNDGSKYIIDLDDTDNGNRAAYTLYGISPNITFQGTKVSVTMNTFNINGFNVYTPLMVLTGGGGMAIQRKGLLDKIASLTPIAYLNIAKDKSLSFLVDSDGKLKDAQSADGQKIIQNLKTFQDENSPVKNLMGSLIQTGTPINNTNTTDGSSTIPASLNNPQNSKTTQTVKDAIEQQSFNTGTYIPNITIDGNKVFPAGEGGNKFASSFYDAISAFANSDSIPTNLGNVLLKKLGTNDGTGSLANSFKGVRTYEDELAEYNNNGKGKAMNPLLHASMHQIGLAADIGSKYFQYSDIAIKYDLRFPYSTEPWHIELNGNADVSVPEELNDTNSAPQSSSSLSPTPTNNSSTNSSTPNSSTNSSASNSTNSIDNTTAQSSNNILQLPVAYRLGDIITILSEAIDEYLIDVNGTISNPTKSVINMLKNYYQVDNDVFKKVFGKNIDDLTDTDIFNENVDQTGTLASNVSQDFKTKIKKVNNSNWNKEDMNSNFNLIFNNTSNSIADTIGYQVIGKDKYNQFIQLLNYFETVICGTNINNMQNDVLTKNIVLNSNIQTQLFTWDEKYKNSFESPDSSTFEPISVGDLPISVDTLSRIMQNFSFVKSVHEFVSQILLCVSLDYGFSLEMIYRTPGSSTPQLLTSVIRDYELRALERRKTSADKEDTYNKQNLTATTTNNTQTQQRNIDFIILDKFLTDNKIVDELSAYATTIQDSTSLSNKKNITGQPSTLVQPKNISSEGSGSSKNVPGSSTYFSNEYGKQKLNDTFMIDYASINSLLKTVNFGNLDGGRSIQNQAAYGLLKSAFNSVNGQPLSQKFTTPEQLGIVKNFSGVQGALSSYIIDTYKFMPGTKEFEIRFLKQLSQIFDSINNNPNNTNKNISSIAPFFSPELKNKIAALQNSTNSANFANPDDRRKFLELILQNYLYNRPMGIKYAFYTAKLGVDIHGTSGLGFGQGIYVRGLVSSMDAYYSINKVTHTISNSTWNTNLDATIIGSDVLTENLNIIKANNNFDDVGDYNSNNNGPQPTYGPTNPFSK